MSGLMCLARELEMMLLSHVFHSLFVSRPIPSDGTSENDRVNTMGTLFFRTWRFLPCNLVSTMCFTADTLTKNGTQKVIL